MVTKFKNLSWLYDFIAMETPIVLNNFLKKNNIIISAFLISITVAFYTIFVVAMVTKFKNLSWLCDFIAMETTFVRNHFPKTNIFMTTFLISIKKMGFIQFVAFAMVTKFKNLSWLYDFIAMENGSAQQIVILLPLSVIPSRH